MRWPRRGARKAAENQGNIVSQEVPQGATPSRTQVLKEEEEKKPVRNFVYFHFVECNECKYSHPLTEENLYQMMVKEPDKPYAIGRRCPRCGKDEWIITAAG